MTLQKDLEDAIAKVQADSEKLKKIVNGPPSGDASEVGTDSGPVHTISRALADGKEQFDTTLADKKGLFDAALAKGKEQLAKLKKIVNGPASGSESTISTDSGPVHTVSRTIAEVEKKFVASDVLSRSTAARDGAETAQKSAETARDKAQTAQTAAETARDEAQAVTIDDADKLQGHPASFFATATALDSKLDKTGKAADADKLDGHDATYYAKAADLSKAVPVATIIASASKTTPDDYMPCDGAALSRTTYATLFAVIGTAFGAGDGSTTFNRPDFRGEFLRGFDGGRGIDPGRGFGSWQGDAFRKHSHLTVSSGGVGRDWAAVDTQHAIVQTVFNEYSLRHNNRQANIGKTNDVGSAETHPRNIAVNFFIKY